jgi:hypothetical protein
MPKNIKDPELLDAISRSRDAYKKASIPGPKKGKPNAVGDFVSYPKGILKEFINKYEKNIHIEDEVLQVIPEKFRANVKGYQLHKNQLSLHIDNASAATQLRFIKTDLLTQLRKNGLWEISNITVKVVV